MNKKPARKLALRTHTVRALDGVHLRDRVVGGNLPRTYNCGGGGDMLPLSNAYPTCCLVGTGCGNLSGTCC